MGTKKIFWKIYERIKSSRHWETNRFLMAIYPLALFCARIFWIVRRTINFVLRPIKYAHQSVVSFSKTDFDMLLATHAMQQRHWRIVKKYYNKVLKKDSIKPYLDPEVRNEIRLNTSVINRLVDVETTQKMIDRYRTRKQRPKIAVYTAIAGGYDTLKLPEVLDPSIDYIIFTDTPMENFGVFTVRPMPYFHEDSTRQARFVKTHPQQLLGDYDIAIWIDANVIITGNISALVKKFVNSKKPIGAIPHPLRNSIYEEGEECIKRNKDEAACIKTQLEHYKNIGFDCHDLIESNLMMFDLRHKKIPDFFTTWWAEIDQYSRRDQLSLNYSMKANDLSWYKLMNRPHNLRSHPLFALLPHRKEQLLLLALYERLRSRKISPYTGTPFSKKRDKLLASSILKNKSIEVVYCVHNALEDVKTCLDSVVKHRKNERLIIIDDGSDTQTKNFLQDFKRMHTSWVTLKRSESGSGYTKAANRGLKASNADLVILLNSDTIVTKDWCAKLAHAVFTTRGAGIVGPLSSAAGRQSIPNYKSTADQTAINKLPSHLTPEAMNDACEEWSVAGLYPMVPLIHGFCFGITRDAINTIGYFDEENFPKGYGEENDYCFRATDAGFGLVLATNTYIYHAKSKSYKGPERIKLMQLGNETLAKLRGKDRIRRAILSMEQNPLLEKIRKNAALLYKQYS